MNEEKEVSSVNKENTIDILVSPKKKESAAPAAEKKSAPLLGETPSKSAPARSGAARARSSEAKSTPKKAVKGNPDGADQTRFVPVTEKIATSTSQIAQKTRVGGATVKERPKSGENKEKNRVVPVKTKKLQKSKKEISPEEKKAQKMGLRATVIIALIYIAAVVLISAILSYFGIRWANDVFALVKEDVTATVSIPENATISEVAAILDTNGLIEYPTIFRMYISFKNRNADPPLAFKAGEYELSAKLNYDQIVSLIKDRKSRSIVTITIPEGYTVDEIIELFTSQGMGTKEGFVDAINNFDYDYTFMDKLNAITLSPERRYRLEGYLFPDTYEFYTDSSEIGIVDKMLTAFEAHFEDAYYARLDEMGMNLDQVVTLASIVQMEGKFNSDFYPISGVFHNRLNSKTLKKLQSDATVQYCLEERKEDLTYADLEVEDPYNTYKIEGLPPSAISNPGWEAIQAALYPESHNYYYFVSDTDGSTVFAKNEPEHLKNVDALRKAKEEGTTID